jgi:hypothetical protein
MGIGCDEARVVEAQDIMLRPDLDFFPLDDQLIIFSEAAQPLVGLNATAAFLVANCGKANLYRSWLARLRSKEGLRCKRPKAGSRQRLRPVARYQGGRVKY